MYQELFTVQSNAFIQINLVEIGVNGLIHNILGVSIDSYNGDWVWGLFQNAGEGCLQQPILCHRIALLFQNSAYSLLLCDMVNECLFIGEMTY